MSNDQSKKQRERYFASGFLRASGLDAHLSPVPSEAPDFLLTFEGRTVGLEVRELHIGNDGTPVSPVARTSIADRIVQNAFLLYHARGGPPVHVSFSFTPDQQLLRVSRDDVARALADALGSHVPVWNGDYQQVAIYEGLPTCVMALHGYTVSEWSAARWYPQESGWKAPLSVAALQGAIDEKAKKLADYLRVVPEVWLLLATGGWTASQFFDAPSREAAASAASPFARTYYFCAFDSQVVRLGIAHDSASNGAD